MNWDLVLKYSPLVSVVVNIFVVGAGYFLFTRKELKLYKAKSRESIKQKYREEGFTEIQKHIITASSMLRQYNNKHFFIETNVNFDNYVSESKDYSHVNNYKPHSEAFELVLKASDTIEKMLESYKSHEIFFARLDPDIKAIENNLNLFVQDFTDMSKDLIFLEHEYKTNPNNFKEYKKSLLKSISSTKKRHENLYREISIFSKKLQNYVFSEIVETELEI